MVTARRMTGSLIGAVVLTCPTFAQPIWQGQSLPGLRRVEEGVADVGPLSVSHAVAPVDLRAPTAFRGVFQFERPVPFAAPESMYARSDGGLWAVFPRSVYIQSPGGLVPEIPAGTVFMIGSPSEARGPGRAYRPTMVDMSIDAQPPPPVLARSVSRSLLDAEAPTIWTSERLRQQRIGRMLESVIDR